MHPTSDSPDTRVQAELLQQRSDVLIRLAEIVRHIDAPAHAGLIRRIEELARKEEQLAALTALLDRATPEATIEQLEMLVGWLHLAAVHAHWDKRLVDAIVAVANDSATLREFDALRKGLE